MPLQLKKQSLSLARTRKRRRREGKVFFYTSGGDLGVTFRAVGTISFSRSNGYYITLGFGAGAWYFKLWDSRGVQVGATLTRTTLNALRNVVNANATLQNYVTMTLEDGVTTVTGSSSLNFADASPFRGGL